LTQDLRKRCGACVFPAGPIVYKERVQKLIVSRLAGALRRQHWFGVFVELFIVVAGILIALQVDNWNEQRKQAGEARAWRTQIIEELQGTRDDLSGRRDYYAKELEFAETALAHKQTRRPKKNPATRAEFIRSIIY
jgi:hypothetical protein